MGETSIEWTDVTWNPVRGCSRVSPGCGGARGEGGCYAERLAARFSGPGLPYEGLARRSEKRGLPQWTGVVRLVPEHLADPLRWKRPRRVFVNSMSDLFHEGLSNETIAAVFGVMAAAPQHTFQILTKRAKRMREWFEWARDFALQQRDIACAPNTARTMLNAAAEYLGTKHDGLNAAWRRLENDSWPLSNVHLGVSCENQPTADERVPFLLATPAAARFVSAEPLLGPIRFHVLDLFGRDMPLGGIDQIIVGGESGPGARPCDLAWIRSILAQCKAAGVPAFCKQLGARPYEYAASLRGGYDPRDLTEAMGRAHPPQMDGWTRVVTDATEGYYRYPRFLNRKGGDPSEWPADLRIREFPTTRGAP